MQERELEVLQWQAEVIEDYLSDVTCISAGYGSGKTFGTVLWCMSRLAHNPGCDGLYIEPQYNLIKRVAIPAFEEVLELLGYKRGLHYRIYKSADNMRVYFPPSGQNIFFATGERPEAIVGMTTLAFAVIDEAALCPKDAYDKAASRLRYWKAKKCQMLLCTTPEGLNWVADMFDSDVQPGWFKDDLRRHTDRKLIDIEDVNGDITTLVHTRVRVETRDNQDNLKPSYIPNLLNTWGFNKAYVDSYVYGYFRPFATGLAYSNYKPPLHNTEPYQPVTNKPIHLTWDFNIAPAWVSIQQRKDYHDTGWYHVWQIYNCADGDAETTDEAILEFAAKHPRSLYKDTPIYIYGDSSGHSKSHKAKGSDYDNIVRTLKRLGYKYVELSAIKANPLERTSVDFVQAAFADNIMRISTNCAMVLKSLVRTCWKDGKRGKLDKPADDTWTHPMDAVKYFLCAIERNNRRRLLAGR